MLRAEDRAKDRGERSGVGSTASVELNDIEEGSRQSRDRQMKPFELDRGREHGIVAATTSRRREYVQLRRSRLKRVARPVVPNHYRPEDKAIFSERAALCGPGHAGEAVGTG